MILRLSLVAFAVLAVVASLQLVGSQSSSAGDSVRKVAVDLKITNEIANQPNGPIGRAQDCTLGVGMFDTVLADVLVYDVPAAGMSGFTLDVSYDGAKVEVTDVQVVSQILGQAPGSGPFQVDHETLPDQSGNLSVEAVDLGTGYESGNGVLARIEFHTIATGFSPVTISLAEVTSSGGQPLAVDTILSGQIEVAVGGCVDFPEICNNGSDDDGDSQVDESEPWPLSADDEDCDGFSAADEAAIGTVPYARCSYWIPPPQWPPDFDNDRLVNISDVLTLKPVFGAAVPPASPRYDIVPSGGINISDVLRIKPFFGADCLN